MIIKLASNCNKNGWQHQLEIDIDKKQYKYGSFLFQHADVNKMTKKQLTEIVKTLVDNGFEKINEV